MLVLAQQLAVHVFEAVRYQILEVNNIFKSQDVSGFQLYIPYNRILRPKVT